MSPPEYHPPPLDPSAVAADQRAQQEAMSAMQIRATGDSASLMARYGILALAGMKGNGPTSATVGS